MPKLRSDGASASADDYSIARLRVAASPLFLRPAEVQRGVELLLLGHGQLVRAADPVLREAGIGRAHARMLGSITIAPNQWPTHAVIDWLNILQRMQDVPQRDARLTEARQVLRSRIGAARYVDPADGVDAHADRQPVLADIGDKANFIAALEADRVETQANRPCLFKKLLKGNFGVG